MEEENEEEILLKENLDQGWSVFRSPGWCKGHIVQAWMHAFTTPVPQPQFPTPCSLQQHFTNDRPQGML
jgi:hypothetical protein